MPPARRTERYEDTHTTTHSYRVNLRRIREMLGLTRDEATARIEPPKLTSAMLARVETGERGLSVEELVQLSVAYQVPLAAILTPWSEDDVTGPPALSGADHKTSVNVAQAWMLGQAYPKYPDAITRYGSAIQGALNARIYTNPKAVQELSQHPTTEKYTELALNELENFLTPLTVAIDTFYAAVTKVCGFDPRPHFDEFESTEENGLWPDGMDPLLRKAITDDPTSALEHLKEEEDKVNELIDTYQIGYGKDAMYSTIPELRNYADAVKQHLQDMHIYSKIETAIKYAYKQGS